MFAATKRLLLTAVAAPALTLGLAATDAHASDGYGCHYKTVTCYERVTCYETRQEAYTKCVTLYDHCGRPYEATRTCYRDVQVPVTKVVPVYKRVKVYD